MRAIIYDKKRAFKENGDDSNVLIIIKETVNHFSDEKIS